MIEQHTLNKVAAITLSFWIAKVIATTLGETAGDFIAQTLGLGYVVGLFVTMVLLIAILAAQIRANTYHATLFWAAIVGTTTAGTEISDMMDRTFGFGYVLGSIVLFAGLALTLAVWYYRKRTLSVEPIIEKDSELLFWVAVVFSNSLGTAFGDALIDPIGMSFVQGALVCSGVIAIVLLLHYLTRINSVFLFWVAFIFTRPFGATFGNFLTKEHARGGLELGPWKPPSSQRRCSWWWCSSRHSFPGQASLEHSNARRKGARQASDLRRLAYWVKFLALPPLFGVLLPLTGCLAILVHSAWCAARIRQINRG